MQQIQNTGLIMIHRIMLRNFDQCFISCLKSMDIEIEKIESCKSE